jgi:hypothetical protein
MAIWAERTLANAPTEQQSNVLLADEVGGQRELFAAEEEGAA